MVKKGSVKPLWSYARKYHPFALPQSKWHQMAESHLLEIHQGTLALFNLLNVDLHFFRIIGMSASHTETTDTLMNVRWKKHVPCILCTVKLTDIADIMQAVEWFIVLSACINFDVRTKIISVYMVGVSWHSFQWRTTLFYILSDLSYKNMVVVLVADHLLFHTNVHFEHAFLATM